MLTIKKATYKISILTYIGVSLIVFCVMFATFMLSSAYFGTENIITGTVELGELDFQVLNNLSTINTFEDNLIMPDEVLDNAITILNARDEGGTNTDNLAPIFVKIKPILQLDSQENLSYLHIELSNAQAWVQASDGFLYYKSELLPGQSVQFNDYFVLSYLLSNSYQDSQLYLALEIEVVQSDNLAYQDVWPTAPTEWEQAVT